MNKLALIIGHNFYSQGALNYKYESEYNFNSRIAEKIAEYLSFRNDLKVKVIDKNGRLIEQLYKFKPDLSIELHFNSFTSSIEGAEALVIDNDSGLTSNKILSGLTKKLEIKSRGTKLVSYGDRGYKNLSTLLSNSKEAFIIEPCFGNFENYTSKKIFENEENYVLILSNAILKTFPEEETCQLKKKKLNTQKKPTMLWNWLLKLLKLLKIKGLTRD